MSLPDSYTGATHTGLEVTWLKADKTPYDLTGVAAVSARIRDLATGQVRDATGTIQVEDYLGGVFTWAFSEADLATAGNYAVQFRATFDDASFDVSVPKSWRVLESY